MKTEFEKFAVTKSVIRTRIVLRPKNPIELKLLKGVSIGIFISGVLSVMNMPLEDEL